MKTTIELLSDKFSEIVNREFTPEQLAETVAKNKEWNDNCCATHDYCDANMLMDEAFQEVMQREFVFFDDDKPETEQQNSDDTDLINQAWDLSKKNEFKV